MPLLPALPSLAGRTQTCCWRRGEPGRALLGPRGARGGCGGWPPGPAAAACGALKPRALSQRVP